MSTPSPIIEKLAKMLKHQESAAAIGSIKEAEAFAGKIQEMLTTHKLEMSDIQFVEQETNESIDEEYIGALDLGVKRETKRIAWQEDLASAVAHCNDCQILISQRSNASWFVGRKTDRQICITVHTYFLTLIDETAESARYAATKSEKERLGISGGTLGAHMRDWQQSFCAGVSQAIQSHLHERRRTLEAALKQASAESTALMHLRKTSEEVASYIDNRFKDVDLNKKRKQNINDKVRNHAAYRNGIEVGNQVALTSAAIGE